MPSTPERRRELYTERIKANRRAAASRRRLEGLCDNCGARPAIEPTFKCGYCKSVQKRISARYYARLRDEAFAAYGGPKCVCCGEKEMKFLSIDHVNGGGNKHRAEINSQSKGNGLFYRWLRRNKYPPGYQVLCMNCNHGRSRNGGVCPHQEKKREAVHKAKRRG